MGSLVGMNKGPLCFLKFKFVDLDRFYYMILGIGEVNWSITHFLRCSQWSLYHKYSNYFQGAKTT